MLLNLKQNVCFQKCISELYKILTCCGGYKDLSLRIISYLDTVVIISLLACI